MLVLASASPRRSDLLKQIVNEFDVKPVYIDESPFASELPEDYVVRVAAEKASAAIALESRDDTVIIAADTTVTIDEKILGKPENFDDFSRMMELLSDREHRVLTAVSILSMHESKHFVSCSQVQFSHMNNDSIRSYWLTGEPQDKAGGYGIQGLGARYVVSIRGSYTGIVGLPLYETAESLNAFTF